MTVSRWCVRFLISGNELPGRPGLAAETKYPTCGSFLKEISSKHVQEASDATDISLVNRILIANLQ